MEKQRVDSGDVADRRSTAATDRNHCSRGRAAIPRLALVGALIGAGVSGVACDREDVRDVKEGVNEADRQIDQLDPAGNWQ